MKVYLNQNNSSAKKADTLKIDSGSASKPQTAGRKSGKTGFPFKGLGLAILLFLLLIFSGDRLLTLDVRKVNSSQVGNNYLNSEADTNKQQNEVGEKSASTTTGVPVVSPDNVAPSSVATSTHMDSTVLIKKQPPVPAKKKPLRHDYENDDDN